LDFGKDADAILDELLAILTFAWGPVSLTTENERTPEDQKYCFVSNAF